MVSTATPGDPRDTAFFGHPRGLMTLFFTEMWERFSYYGMKAFLIFYVTADVAKGGLGWSEVNGGIVLAIYTSSVYLMSVPGGWIADRFLGHRRAVLYGGVLIMFGHIVLALPFASGLYLGLGLIVYGTGLLKPNISNIVGNLYAADDIRRDAGFSIYYVGINLGAGLAPLVCGYLAQDNGFRGWVHDSLGLDPNVVWHIAFGSAAVGMFFGLLQFLLGTKHLGDAGKEPVKPADAAEARRLRMMLVGILVGSFGLPVLLIGLVLGGVLDTPESLRNFDGILLTLFSLAVFVPLYLWGCKNRDETRRLTVILLLFVGATVAWACFEQASTVLSLFADKYTDRTILGYSFPSSWYQFVNPLCIWIFSPLVGYLWLTLARKKREPSAPAKFGVALVLIAAGFAVMIPPALGIDAGTITHSGPWWLVMLYALHTFGELCFSPVGLSSMSKLAPARWGGLVFGIWFLATANGDFLAGSAVALSSSWGPSTYFTIIPLFPLGLAAIFFVLVKPIGRMLARPAT